MKFDAGDFDGASPCKLRARWHSRAALLSMMLTLFAPPSSAQYAYSPGALDEQGVRYFGAVKDTTGRLIAGATLQLESGFTSYVLVSDELGRFRVGLPLDTSMAKVIPKCWKAGFRLVRIAKRPGPAGAKPSVQIDCVLRQSSSG